MLKLAQCLENKINSVRNGGGEKHTKRVYRVKSLLAWRNLGKKPLKIAVDSAVLSLQMARQSSWEGIHNCLAVVSSGIKNPDWGAGRD